MSSVRSVPTSGYRSGFDVDGSAEASPSRPARGRRNSAVHTPLILATVAIVAVSCHLRWSLASTTFWQCDEIPLLVRFTGLCGHVTNDQEAREFKPGYYTFYMGALRSLRAPKFIAAIHTTTGFWVNLSIHLFGVTPAAGRLIPFIWSIAAIAAAVWGTWLVARSIPAACIAAFLVALSPHAVAYAAQARGYAEAMALAPVLLIALEYYRRRPDGWFRALAVMICAIQLSLTVFTMWVYWVAPTLLLAIFVLPRLGKSRQDGRTMRTVLVVITAALAAFMTLYTIDRWRQLSFAASYGGVDLHSAGDVWVLIRNSAAHLTLAPLWTALFGAVGFVVMWRSKVRWWMLVGGVGVAAPVLLAVVNGSAGYPRNFGYLVVPIAILAASGAGLAISGAMRRFGGLTVASVAAIVLIGGSAWLYADLESRVRAVILPDWGDTVTTLDREPETVGPRWFCHSPANYWQINWYRAPEHLARCLAVLPGGHIEVVMGTQRDDSGREIVYQADRAVDAIVPCPVPGYIDAVPIAGTNSGVALRRWRGTRIDAEEATRIPSDDPVFALVTVPAAAADRNVASGAPAGREVTGASLWDRLSGLSSNRLDRASPALTPASRGFQLARMSAQAKASGSLKNRNGGEELVAFSSVSVGDSVVRSFITPARLVSSTHASLMAEARIDASSIHWFRLSPLARLR